MYVTGRFIQLKYWYRIVLSVEEMTSSRRALYIRLFYTCNSHSRFLDHLETTGTSCFTFPEIFKFVVFKIENTLLKNS